MWRRTTAKTLEPSATHLDHRCARKQPDKWLTKYTPKASVKSSETPERNTLLLRYLQLHDVASVGLCRAAWRLHLNPDRRSAGRTTVRGIGGHLSPHFHAPSRDMPADLPSERGAFFEEIQNLIGAPKERRPLVPNGPVHAHMIGGPPTATVIDPVHP